MVSDSFEDLVKCGYLELKLPRKHRKLGRKAWKRKWFVLRRKSSQGSPRLEYYRSEEACLRAENKTIVSLQSLVKIEKDPKSRTRRHAVKLAFADTFLFLATDGDSDMQEWTRLIKKLVLPDPKPTPIFRIPQGTFLVTVIHTEDSERMGLVGDFLLSISPEQVVLRRIDGNQSSEAAIARWELDDIPRFRLQKLNHLNDVEKIFIMNVGRTSHFAEGEYQFLTPNGREILETVKSHTTRRSRSQDGSPRSTPLGDLATASSSNSSCNLDHPRSRSSSSRSHVSRQSNSGNCANGSRACVGDKVAACINNNFDAVLQIDGEVHCDDAPPSLVDHNATLLASTESDGNGVDGPNSLNCPSVSA